MNKIQETIEKIRKCKEHEVNLQKYEEASCWVDLERNLRKVINGEPLKLFLEQFKRSKYRNFDQMYEVIKPLDVVFLRKEKILKINGIKNME